MHSRDCHPQTLVLQLIHTKKLPKYVLYGMEQFLHIDKIFTDFNEIWKEIEQETFMVAGQKAQNKDVRKLPISLRIYSPNVLDLIMVDLPGLTKVGVRLSLGLRTVTVQVRVYSRCLRVPITYQWDFPPPSVRPVIIWSVWEYACIITAICGCFTGGFVMLLFQIYLYDSIYSGF
jgi:hypothetical protein